MFHRGRRHGDLHSKWPRLEQPHRPHAAVCHDQRAVRDCQRPCSRRERRVGPPLLGRGTSGLLLLVGGIWRSGWRPCLQRPRTNLEGEPAHSGEGMIAPHSIHPRQPTARCFSFCCCCCWPITPFVCACLPGGWHLADRGHRCAAGSGAAAAAVPHGSWERLQVSVAGRWGKLVRPEGHGAAQPQLQSLCDSAEQRGDRRRL
mmetsp:Transcript_2970/g.8365  ORF Transcript_2970/g.8365 Transcript_2970/m.8365 type:complete len:202 (-) Transcript_2970:1025-1630(-)